MLLHPDITISLLRREINFLNDIKDGSRKIGELHINRANYRNFEAHDSNYFKNLFARFWSNNLLSHLRKLDKLVVLTEKDREAWKELDNVVTIPDPLSFVPTSVSPLTEKRVVAIARYSHEKGIDLLLRAWAIVEQKTVEWRLDVFGDGDRTSYEQLMRELKIDRNRCLLHGRTNNVEQEYLQSSIFASSSRFEGFGLVLTEAMACGLPVVSFDCPWGPRSIISDGEDGLLVENGNVDAFALCLSQLMQNPLLCKSMAKAGQANVQRFYMEHIAKCWKDVFESNENFT